MSQTVLKPAAKTTSASRESADIAPVFFALAALLILEIAAFGLNAKNVGVYQDEWIYFGRIHFRPHSLTSIWSAFLWDPRIIVRPIEAIWYGTLYFFCWEKPLWYHVACYTSEFIGACFVFLAAARISRSRLAGFVAAVSFLLYPNHDATHYYITASVESVSATFFAASLWLFVKGLEEEKPRLIAWSVLHYLLSVYFYEQTLPLVVLYPLATLLIPRNALKTRAIRLCLYQAPFCLVAVSVLVYRSWFLPQLRLGWNYSTCFSFKHFVDVLMAGLNCSLSPYLVAFCAKMSARALAEGMSPVMWAALIAATITTFVCASKQFAERQKRTRCLQLVLLGLGTALVAYTIFGISPEHMPILDGWRNRVNIGGSLGASFVLGGLAGMMQNVLVRAKAGWTSMLVPVLLCCLASAFILTDWEFAKQWVVSWQSQKEIMATLRNHASEIGAGDSIIIGGITRYADWAPVVDGVWDFENIAKTTLNRSDIQGNVMTERMRLVGDELVDRSGSLILGRYPFKRMILFAPAKSRWQRISSRQQFLKFVQESDWKIPSFSKP